MRPRYRNYPAPEANKRRRASVVCLNDLLSEFVMDSMIVVLHNVV